MEFSFVSIVSERESNIIGIFAPIITPPPVELPILSNILLIKLVAVIFGPMKTSVLPAIFDLIFFASAAVADSATSNAIGPSITKRESFEYRSAVIFAKTVSGKFSDTDSISASIAMLGFSIFK